MNRSRWIPRSAFASLVLVCLAIGGSRTGAAEPVDYLKQIKPLLTARCVACHGALKQEGGLRLDTAALAIRGGENGAAIKPGVPDDSLLLRRVTSTDEALRMPQEGEALKVEQIAWLRAWIEQRAAAPADEPPERDPRDHWAFRPVVRPAVPKLANAPWPRNPIDAFVGIGHERLGLTPQKEAARSLLVRRLYLDLLGVPPSLEELARHDADQADGWYERLAQQLLDDPRYGERWGRHWMDVWRYSDWWGLGDQLRNSQQHIWHWRDWIVESLNADLPYDEMVRLMLAADELHPNDLDRLRATGFLARNYFLFNRNQWMDESVEHVSKAFFGLTMNCTKCHDHKFDPFEQTDFYRLRAFFEPYHVRLDMAPGQADFNRDAIPRVFDGTPDEPTYRFVRGQEGQPDKSTPIAPGVPRLLQFKELTIQPVDLPAEAWQPERRPWVQDALRQTSQQAIATAEQAAKNSHAKVATAKKKEAELIAAAEAKKPEPAAPDAKPTPAEPTLVDEKFATLDRQRWQVFGGEWAHEPGRLEQKKDGAQRAGLRLQAEAPRDFDVTLRFTILGGSQWRSVSLGFDSTQSDPVAAPGPGDSEQSVYVSAVQGGSKVQAAYHEGGQWRYPTEGLRAMPIELKKQYVLRVQVRGTLINALLDGQPVLAWRTPLARRAGAMQITTFDALTVFHEISIAPLKSDAVLREPNAAPDSQPTTPEGARRATADAELEARIADLAVEIARAELVSLDRRAEASRVATEASVAPNATVAAVQAERAAAVLKARQVVATVELKLLRAAADKRESVEKELKTAQEAAEKAVRTTESAVAPTDKFTPLVGAKWTPTRFRSSGADDPTVTFPSRSTGRRKALAEWITDSKNPLTARVAVNHLWARHFGTPLVATVFDFGRKGAEPTHPELLDWLAAELVGAGWSMKHMHRLIVTSATYRLDSTSAGREANVAQDADNRQLWRRTPLRIESQAVRDSILSLAGTLDATRGGPPVMPAAQAESRRRSLYFFHSNNERNLFLTTFDEAAVKECYRRDQSIVPQQALALTNSRLVLDAAAPIAARIENAGRLDAAAPRQDDAAFVKHAFRYVLGAEPNEAETAASLKALAAWNRLPDGAKSARANFVWALLNHNDFVTIR